MGQIEATLRENIQKLSGTYGLAIVTSCDAEVVSVDRDNRHCIVNCIDSNKSLDAVKVRFCPTVDDGDIEIPEIGSVVTIIFTSFTEPYISSKSGLSSKSIFIGDQKYVITDGMQQFNDGGYGGLVIVKDPDNSNSGLLAKINQLENKYNDLVSKYNGLISTFNSHTHVYSPGPLSPAPTATPIPTSSGTETPISPITSEDDISNPNITHGKSEPQQ